MYPSPSTAVLDWLTGWLLRTDKKKKKKTRPRWASVHPSLLAAPDEEEEGANKKIPSILRQRRGHGRAFFSLVGGAARGLEQSRLQFYVRACFFGRVSGSGCWWVGERHDG